MKTTIKTITMACLMLGLTITSCQKETETAPAPTPSLTKTQLLTSKNWKMTAYTSNPAIDWNNNGTMVTDVYTQIPDCHKDDINKFNTNGVGIFDEGATKCDAADPQTTSGTWIFNTNETIITIDDFYSYTIETLNATTLKMSSVYNDGTTNYTLTVTYTKQ